MPFNLNSRILLSAASIAAAAALLVGATFAFFSDNETSTQNVFAAGTLDLVLCDDDETAECPSALEAATDGTVATFGGINMTPGGASTTGTLTLRNNGTVAGDHVDIEVSNAITQATDPPGDDSTNPMDRYLKVTTLTYDGGDLLAGLTNTNVNGFIDLEDLANQDAEGSEDLVNLALTDTATDHLLVMTVQLDSSAPNNLQGDSVDVTLTATLNQDASQ